jgi:sulfur transfer complex TusBCD TusB component (DsrH family)
MARSRLGETGGFLTEVYCFVLQPKDKILIQKSVLIQIESNEVSTHLAHLIMKWVALDE